VTAVRRAPRPGEEIVSDLVVTSKRLVADRVVDLRHYNFELYLEQNDGSQQFAQDATFCVQPGSSGSNWSFESGNYPNKYIRHYDYVAYIASDGGSNAWGTATLWTEDSTWQYASPWA
jgi:hypothetical protein